MQGRKEAGAGFGATALWQVKFDGLGAIIPGTGFAALIMRFDPARVLTPTDLHGAAIKEGFAAVFDVDTFLCCNPGLNFARTKMFTPPPSEDVLIQNPSVVVAPDVGVIYDPCHGSQYDPFRLVWDTHPNGQRYLAANRVWGPGTNPPQQRGGLPIIPIDVLQGKPTGVNDHPEWYRGYCGM